MILPTLEDERLELSKVAGRARVSAGVVKAAQAVGKDARAARRLPGGAEGVRVVTKRS